MVENNTISNLISELYKLPYLSYLSSLIYSIQNYPWKHFLSYNNFLPFIWVLSLLFIFRFFRFIYKNCIRRRVNMIKRYGKDSWALVTGATDGIGKAFCQELAIIGFNIILVSRNPEKLKKVALEIRQLNSSIKTVEIEFDFDKRNQLEDYLSVFDKNLVDKYDISIVVNNVGTDYHKPWSYFSNEETFRLINLNIKPQTMLTKIFLEKLINRNEKQKSKNNDGENDWTPLHCAFINLSSFCSDFPFPGKSIYSSTKIFDHYLSHALREEYINSNIDFISFKPLGVATPLTPKPCDYVSILPARQCVRSCLDDLVHESETYGHWLHKIQSVLINCVPNFILYPFLRHCWYSLVMNIKFDKDKKN